MNLTKLFSNFGTLLFLLIFCAKSTSAQQVIKTDTSKYNTIRIDPARAIGANASDVLDEVNYIPLETTDASLFGTISQLQVTSDRFIIRDDNTKCILFFDKKGKFINKIQGRDNGPLGSIGEFTIEPFAKRVVYTADAGRTLTYADLNGNILKKEKVRTKDGYDERSRDFFYLTPTDVVSYDSYSDLKNTDEGYLPHTRSMIRFMKDGKVYASGLHYTEAEGSSAAQSGTHSGGVGPLTYFGDNSVLFFSKPFANSIYKISSSGIKLAYKFIFPIQSTIPADFTTNLAYRNKPAREFSWQYYYFTQHPDVIYTISNCYQIGNNLMFSAICHKDNLEDNLIYNLKSGTLLGYKHLLPDELSQFLPLYDASGASFKQNGFAACDGRYSYTSISSLSLFKNKENQADKDQKYNNVMTRYFATQSRKSNPVIIQVKLKEKL